MPQPVYATPEQWAAYPTDADVDDAEVPGLLHRASEAVDSLLVGAVYATDDADMPTDSRVIEALTSATLAQAEWFAETGDTSGAFAAAGSVSLGALSLGGGTGGRSPAAARVSPAAVAALRVAGLTVAVGH